MKCVDVGDLNVRAEDGKIKASRSLGVFVRLISGLWRPRQKGLLALYENSPMISMLFAPSIIVFGRFVIRESWTAREKRHHPVCASG
jgi:hypothetical protein